MKIFFSLLLLVIISFISCDRNEDENLIATRLEVSLDDMSFDADQGKKTITIETDGVWLIKGSSEWCFVNKKAGRENSSIEISADKNALAQSRETIFILEAGSFSRKLKVHQSPYSYTLELSNTDIYFSKNNETKTFTIKTNEDWFISDIPYWCKTDKYRGNGNSEVKLTVNPNNSVESRESFISVKSQNNEVKLRIIQTTADFIVDESGTLKKILTDRGLLASKDLILAGTLNYHDFVTLRELENLKKLDIGNIVIEECTVFDPSHQKSITYPMNYLPDYAFQFHEQIAVVKLPENLEVIGSSAFAYAYSLISVNIPSKVHLIKEHAFYNTRLKRITIPSSLVKMESGVFALSSLGSVVFEEGLSTIEVNTFRQCGGLNNIELPKSLKIIKERAFQDCGFTSILIPENVEVVEYMAFGYCSWLEKVYMRGEIAPQLDNSAFWQISSNCKLYIPKGSKNAYTSSVWRQFDIIEEL